MKEGTASVYIYFILSTNNFFLSTIRLRVRWISNTFFHEIHRLYFGSQNKIFVEMLDKAT